MNLSQREQALSNKTLMISCIVPAHNEQAIISEFLHLLDTKLQTLSSHYEIIVIDDGSSDDTVQLVKQCRQQMPVKILSFSRNFGKEVAITAGLEYCQGDVAIIIDADCQHPLDTIAEFLKKWQQGYDMVFGIRENREHESALKRVFTKLFYQLMQKMTKTSIPPNAGDFRLLDRPVIDALNNCDERNRFMKGLYGWVGFKSIGVNYRANERKAGNSSWHPSRLIELAITGITSFSSIPLRAWGLIGFVISIVSLAYALFIVLDTLIFGVDVPGFATIIVAVMFFGGVQLLSIGILGEYIGRIFDEVKQRPKYIIAYQAGFNDDASNN